MLARGAVKQSLATSASRAEKEQSPQSGCRRRHSCNTDESLALCLALVAACKKKAIDLPSEETKKEALHHDAFYEFVNFVSSG